MPFVAADDGVRLKYEVVGAGQPLVLHLGAGCDSALWHAAGYLEPLSADYQCIPFDHRGHGESDHPSDAAAYHIDRLAQDVICLLDDQGIESAAFWAYSSGTVWRGALDRRPVSGRMHGRCLLSLLTTVSG